MKTVAFLRGMNVGGHRLTNDTLKEIFVELGFTGVQTYRASGNVIVQGPADAAHIEAGLESALGYAVPTFLRSDAETKHLAAAAPFSAEELAASTGKIQVTLLAELPSAQIQAEVLERATAEDRLAFVQRSLFWLPKAGTLDSTLDHKALEHLLGVGTTRTIGTLQGVTKKL